MDISDFVKKLPKAELHLHLEGTVEPSTLVELSSRVDETPLTLEEAEALYHYEDFTGYIQAFTEVNKRFVGPTEYKIVTLKMIERLSLEGVCHAEVFISIGELLRAKAHLGQSDDELFQSFFSSIEEGRIQGEAKFGVTVGWLLDASRHQGPDEGRRVFSLAMRFKNQYPSIIGIGLGGDERVFASEPFRDILREVMNTNLRITNHAGENTPPHFITEALSVGSERLGHCTTAPADPELMKELARRQIPIEVNPTSNIRLGNCESFAKHPLRTMFDAQLFVTLNSDDPAFFGSWVAGEYLLAHQELQFSRDELKQLAINSFWGSFLPDDKKIQYVQLVEEFDP